ncbi:MAG: BON domain-containing protein [Kiritimatiellae bacterium]|jgi:osmotically-inducible protein OsmY|nr:BON domain-containing protein [Kiritimatiellia bacterium]MDD4340841.1 BON domain-containing protein [Kiritimatiellia bacterium]MDY0149686.1 BON domain-containing protein [Kiritimatiellia bacterium]
MKTTSLILAAIMALFVFSGCAGLSDAAWDHPTSDEDIATLATTRLNNDAMIARATLSVSVENGMARLYGTVPDQVTRQRAIQILEGTPGIFDVMDRTRRR